MTKPSGNREHIAPVAERPFLPAAERLTFDAMFSHPLPYLPWSKMLALFEVLGTVEPRSADQFSFRIGAEHHLLHKPHDDDLTPEAVVELRHLVERAGLAPDPVLLVPPPHPVPHGLLITVDHHEAKVFEIDVSDPDPERHEIKPYDPHGFLHRLAHKDQSRERGQRAAEDPAFYEQIAQAAMTATGDAGAHVVVVGHGHGHSSAAHHFVEYLKTHHREIYGRTVTELVADLARLTDPELLAIGRRALLAQPE